MATQDSDQFMNWWDWTQTFPGDIFFSGMIIATIVTIMVGIGYLSLSIIFDGRADKYQLIGKGTDVIVACSLQLGVAIAVLSLSNVGADLGTDIAIWGTIGFLLFSGLHFAEVMEEELKKNKDTTESVSTQ